jgi:radical SAM peptide maturase (CXXX-repeat target family)
VKKFRQYSDQIARLYSGEDVLDEHEFLTRNITFQITDDCCCACTYCYQGHKGHRMMTKDVAKRGVDLLFDMYDKNEGTFINHKTKAIILDFIGGEPLMNIDIIDYVCTYFVQKCLEKNHPWIYTWRASMISNGALYFEPKVQEFLKKFRGFVSFGITLDGPKEIHNACRIYHDGRGNFDDAYAAMKHFNSHYYEELGTKVTIAPENLHNLNKIVKFFVDEGMEEINANTVFEAEWTEEQAQEFYRELKKMADYLLSLDHEVYVGLFRDELFKPMSEEENSNFCGGTGAMLSFDPDGIAYPCIRYMPSSLGDDVPPITIGTVDGIFETEEDKETKRCLDCITRRSQSTDECWNCPIAAGCAWCSGWNYQLYGTPDKRCTRICPMHKARSLANVYYWNKYYHKNNMDKHFEMHLPKEEALKFISEDEYNMLLELSTK